MKLYYSPGACSMSPHIVLREIGKKFDLESVDLGTKKTATGKDYTKINPKGYVPALELKPGDVLTEGAVIVQYLADKAKATKLLPKAGSMARYRAVEMLNYIAAELHKTMGALFAKTISEDVRKATMEKLTKRLDHFDGILAKSKFLLGKSFSVADAYAFTIFSWGPHLKVDMSPWKNIAAYMERIGKRPAVQAVLKAEGLSK
ncbi:MAG: glutathione transferase GstA [Pseudomonadota bacterium]|nr:glutathione transferase GstA [Pseudomonadota bacterium]